MIERLGALVVLATALTLVLLVAAVLAYRHLYQDARDDLAALRAQIQRQNDEAKATLVRLTAERDQKQAELNRQAKDQEHQDAQAQAEIDRLTGELESRPVRVRVVTARCDHGGAAADTATHAADRPADHAAADGLLPPDNTRRLNAALSEVETLNAAYASCRNTLLIR